MSFSKFKTAAIVLAAPSLALSVPAAASISTHSAPAAHSVAISDVTVEHGRDRYDRYDRRNRYDRRDDRRYGQRDQRGYYGEPVRRDTRVWRDRDGQYRCQKDDGTTGLLIGAGVGGLIGHEVAGRGDRTLGAILGAAGGALLGRTIDRSSTRCR